MLSNEVAEKTNEANILTQKCYEVKYLFFFNFVYNFFHS